MFPPILLLLALPPAAHRGAAVRPADDGLRHPVRGNSRGDQALRCSPRAAITDATASSPICFNARPCGLPRGVPTPLVMKPYFEQSKAPVGVDDHPGAGGTATPAR